MHRSLALIVALSACQAAREPRLDPRAPCPDARAGNLAREESQNGCLTVSTARIRVDQEGRPFGLPHDLDGDSSHLVSTGYTVFDREGRALLEFPNHSPLVVVDEEPASVELPPGRYLLRLHRPVGGVRTFWVTIEPRGHTEVDPARLDRVEEPPLR
jgi:hypothetical protein